MNETELEDKIERDFLDGVSTKPMTYEKLKHVLRKVGLVDKEKEKKKFKSMSQEDIEF